MSDAGEFGLAVLWDYYYMTYLIVECILAPSYYIYVSKCIETYPNVSKRIECNKNGRKTANYKKVRGRDGSVITTIDEKYGGMY